MIIVSAGVFPPGEITLGIENGGLVRLWLEGQNPPAPSGVPEGEDRAVFEQTVSWLTDYFVGKKPEPSRLRLTLTGSPFCLRVLSKLLFIPYGESVTYGELAGALAREAGIPSMSARAVGGAAGRNPLPIIVPCHRVLGAGGALTGYGGGLKYKILLLEAEGIPYKH